MNQRQQKKLLNDQSFKRSTCGVACSLDVIGDKWTLLVIRDLFFGKTKFKEFQASRENIPTNILANRLQMLEQSGLVERTPYQERPLRYEYHLTGTGRSLEPVLLAIRDWANKQLPGTRKKKK